MFRKLTLGLTAAIALTAAALAPSSASAFTVKFGGGWHPHHHHHHHSAFWGPSYGPSYGFGSPAYVDCLQKRLIQTKKGPRWRTVNVCY